MKSKPLFPNQPVTTSGLPPSQELVEIVQRIVSDIGVLSAFTDLLTVANAGLHFRVSSTGTVELAPSIFQTADQTITLAGALGPFAHGLGAVPKLVTLFLVCQTAELGYSIGDITVVNSVTASITVDATNINIRFNSAAPSIVRKDTGVIAAFTAANWKLRVVAQI